MQDENLPLIPVSANNPSPEPGEGRPDVFRPGSPKWGANTKLIIGFSMAALGAFLLFRFLNIIGPLLLAIVLAYLFYPLAENARAVTRIPWRGAVTLLYLILVVLLLGALAIGGLAVLDQLQSLIRFLENALNGLPAYIESLSAHPIIFGPFRIDPNLLDTDALVQQVLDAVRPLLSQAGTSVVSLASGTASFVGWTFFILLVSYFILAESGGFPNRLISLSIPGHDEDIRRIGAALNRIWNAFLRGQLAIVLLTLLIYTVLLGALGVRFFFGLALLAGLARFVPYVGPFVAWTTYGLVAYFQPYTIFGLSPLAYAGLVVGSAWVMDMFLDNFVTPRLMSNALRVHPAAVMISALVALNLLGVVGVVMAAPVLATMKLFVDYIFAKLFDQDPWENMATISAPNPLPPLRPLLQARFAQVRAWFGRTGFPRPK
jgi:predicted PurR-regulated permease PerM